MTETMTNEHTPTLGALAKALAAAQGKIQGARKTAQNPHLRNKYATLSDVWDACRDPLSSHGLAVVQTTEPHGKEGVCVVTTLLHESGEWIRSRLFLPVSKPDAQGFGSALTYARRYALSSMVGVCPDDDDANEAVGTSALAAVVKAEPTSAQSAEVEKGIAALLEGAKTVDDLAKAEATAARAVKAGSLSGEARKRLHELRGAAVKRLSNGGAAA
jgi:hypothetical protein